MQNKTEMQIAALAKKIVADFSTEKIALAGAESCTGGAVASAIVAVAGASAVFRGSAVCYCDAAKTGILGVEAQTIQTHFAESPQCALQMAEGALKIYGAQIAFATTGFLDANTGARPRSLGGNVFIAAAKADDGKIVSSVERVNLNPAADRNANRRACVLRALEAILKIAG